MIMHQELVFSFEKAVNCVFRLKLRAGVTLIKGVSGVGKTLLYDALNSRSDTLCFNYTTYKYRNSIIDSIEKNAKNGSIVVIDNVDILMTDELSDYIMEKNNGDITFILIGRKCFPCVQVDTWICDLVRKQCEDGSIEFYLNYMCTDLDECANI